MNEATTASDRKLDELIEEAKSAYEIALADIWDYHHVSIPDSVKNNIKDKEKHLSLLQTIKTDRLAMQDFCRRPRLQQQDHRSVMKTDVHFSSVTEEWATPQCFFDKISKVIACKRHFEE